MSEIIRRVSRIPRATLNNITPFTYRDGYTFLQRLEMLALKINELVETASEQNEYIDGFAESVNTVIDELEQQYSDFSDELRDEWAGILGSLIEYTIEVTEYVYTARLMDGSEFDAYTIAGTEKYVSEQIVPLTDTINDFMSDMSADMSDLETNLTTSMNDFQSSVNQQITDIESSVNTQIGDAIDTLTNQVGQAEADLTNFVNDSVESMQAGYRLGDVFSPNVDYPRIIQRHDIFSDDTNNSRTVDGAKYIALLNTEGLPGTWIDKWYGYVSGHDSTTIWLVTAPSILGPWTWRQGVISLHGSQGGVVDPKFRHHVSAPSVLWDGDHVKLYYHGIVAEGEAHQPTALATSTNGIDFSLKSNLAIPTELDNFGSPQQTSTSYAQVKKFGGIYHAIWQGNFTRNSEHGGISYAQVPTGYGTSVDGETFVARAPIIRGEGPGDHGAYSPGFTRYGGRWLVVGNYRRFSGTSSPYLEFAVYVGDSLESVRRVGTLTLPGFGTQVLNSAQFVVEDNKLWMVGGGTPSPGNPGIFAFEMG